jgi:hypothetical protein
MPGRSQKPARHFAFNYKDNLTAPANWKEQMKNC